MVQYHVWYYTKLSLYHLIYQFQDDAIQLFQLCENKTHYFYLLISKELIWLIATCNVRVSFKQIMIQNAFTNSNIIKLWRRNCSRDIESSKINRKLSVGLLKSKSPRNRDYFFHFHIIYGKRPTNNIGNWKTK